MPSTDIKYVLYKIKVNLEVEADEIKEENVKQTQNLYNTYIRCTCVHAIIMHIAYCTFI